MIARRGLALGAVVAAFVGLVACTVKQQASDTICIPDQRDRCTDCTKPDPSDKRTYRGWHTCSHDGKSFSDCSECAADDATNATPAPPGATPPSSDHPPEPGSPSIQPPPDGGEDGGRHVTDNGADCNGPLAFGDLAIVELMIASTKDSDLGEWFEVQSTRDCTLHLQGLHIESPRADGLGPDTVDLDTDITLPPNGTFIVADGADSATNHGLPGIVLSWSAPIPDSLANKGADSIRITSLDGTVIDALTFDATSWIDDTTLGHSVSFSSYCAFSQRQNWGNWSFSNSLYSPDPKLIGTPNTDNSDVSCPNVQ